MSTDNILCVCHTCHQYKPRQLMRVDGTSQCKACKALRQRIRRKTRAIMQEFDAQDVLRLTTMLKAAKTTSV